MHPFSSSLSFVPYHANRWPRGVGLERKAIMRNKSEPNGFSLRRGLRRHEAALYIGVGLRKFEMLVAEGRMPGPVRIDGCSIWDVRQLDAIFDDLAAESANDNQPNAWDDL